MMKPVPGPTHLFESDEEPRAFGIDNGLSVQESALSGSPSLSGLQRDYQTSDNDNPGGDSIGPCGEYVPPWQVIVAALSLLCAGILLVKGDGKSGTIFLACSLGFVAGCMLLSGHEYYCADGKSYPYDPRPEGKQFLHNRENVSRKHLTYTVYL